MKNWLTLALVLFLASMVLWDCAENKTSRIKKTGENELDENELQARGQAVAMATFSALSVSLQAALKKGGIEEAIRYCNLAALPITDSLSQVHNALIRRTSLRTRNKANDPNGAEKKQLNKYVEAMDRQEQISPVIRTNTEGGYDYYMPIITAELCLNCHGSPGTDFSNDEYKIISLLYPEDRAVGYRIGDLRGMWSIHLEK